MFLFLLTTATLAQHLIFQDYFTTTTLDSTLWDTSNATLMTYANIVACPGTTSDSCLTFTKQAVGGALYTKPISIENQQDITVEFQYLTKSTAKKGPYSNLFVGYTDTSRSGYCWAASGYSYLSTFFVSNSGYNGDKYLCQGFEAVQIFDLLDSWKTIKFTIPSKYLVQKSINEIVLVFEDFAAGYNDPGAYYLTSVLAYYNKNCTTKCDKCTTFYDCTSCSDGYRWLEGKCYVVDCGNSLEQTIPYGLDTLQESTTSTSYTATITIPGYYFAICWPAQWVTLDVDDGKFTEVPFSYNSNSESATMVISQSNITQINCKQNTTNSNIFTCKFHFNVHFNEQIMYEKNWTAIIDFSSSTTQSAVVKYDASNLPALAISIESTLEYCTNVDDCVWTTSNITLILNQFFKVKLTLVDSNLYSWIMEKGYVKLSGSGTLANLQITNTDNSTAGSIIYTVKLGMRGSKGTGILVAAKITNPNKSRRRILDGTTTTISETITINTVTSNDKVTASELESSLITFKNRELKIEADPEYSQLVGILVLLLLSM